MSRSRVEGTDSPRTFRDGAVAFAVVAIAVAIALGIAAPLMNEVPELLRLHGSSVARDGGPTSPGAPVLGTGRLRASTTPTALNPFCEVIHEHYVSGKGGGWRTDEDWIFRTSPGVEFPDGTLLPISVQHASMPGTPYQLATAAEEAEVRKRASIASGGRLRLRCARADAPVFVDGCIVSEDPRGANATPPLAPVPTLGACPGSPEVAFFKSLAVRGGPRPLALTAAPTGGDPRLVRLRDAVAPIPGRLGLLALVLAVPLFLAIRGRRGWGMIGVLRAHHGRPEKSLVGPTVIALGIVFVAGLILGNITLEITWLSAMGALLPPAIFGLIAAWSAQMATDVDALLAPTEALATTPLATAEGEEVELAVHVASDAPVEPSIFGTRRYAFSRVTVWETRPQGKGTVTQICFLRSGPTIVPIVDRSGRGELDTRECAFNLFCEESGTVPPALAKVLPTTPSFSYRVREESLLPGEALYLLGRVGRETDDRDRARDAGGYRSVASHAVLRGEPAKPLLVVAGTEEALVGALRPAITRFRVGRVLFAALACIAAASALLFAIGR